MWLLRPGRKSIFPWNFAKEIVEGNMGRGLAVHIHVWDEGRHSESWNAQSQRRGAMVSVCFLKCLVAVVEVRCVQWKNRKEK